MKRPLTAVIVALLVWIVVASVLDRLLRALLAGYADAEPTLHFTLAMQLARLLLAAAASLAAGAAAARIAPATRWAALVPALLLLALFVPEHVRLWHAFPLWYHLTFLLTLVPLVLAGAALGRAYRRPPAAPSPARPA